MYEQESQGYEGYPETQQNLEEENESLLKLQIDVEQDLKKFENEVLRGLIEVTNSKTGEKTWVPIAPKLKPPMNELGIREMLSRIRGRVTKIAKLSFKDDKEIYQDMFYFDMSITELIAKRSDKWELDMEIAKSIKDSAVEIVWDLLASSRNGFTAINLRSQYQRQDVTRMDQQSKEGKSFLGIPLGGKK